MVRPLARSTTPAAASGSSASPGTGPRRTVGGARASRAGVLRPARRRQGRDRDGPRRRGVAGLVPARRRAHVGPAGPQGGDLLRYRARPRAPGRAAGRPLHGANLFPATPAGLGPAVLDWIDTMTALGTVLLRAVALGLALPPDWFERHVTDEPTVLFRIFRYPPGHDDGWGVAEHTDYGLLTILATDDHDGLQVHAPERVDRRAVGSGGVRRQPRRHARPDDRGPLPVDAAPRASTGPGAPGCRSRASSTRRGTRCARRCRSTAAHRPTTPPAAGTARACGGGTGPTASTSRPRSPRCSPRCAENGQAVGWRWLITVVTGSSKRCSTRWGRSSLSQRDTPDGSVDRMISSYG